jgi:AAA family ATP:ADP antiporter
LNLAADFIKKILSKTFDIREGEYQRVLLMQVNIFLIIFVLLIIKPVVNAQFLSVIGVERLPFVFLLAAACAMMVSMIYARALNNRSLRRVTSNTLYISISLLVIIALLLDFNIAERFVLYFLYVGVAIFGVLTTSQFWIMANLAFDAREAKRVFGFIGAGPIAGGVAGGYATSLLAPHVSAGTLLMFAAALLAIGIPLNNLIWKKHISRLNTFQKQKRLKGFGQHPVNLILQSKHLTYLAVLVGLGVIVTKLVDYQFSSVSADAFPDPEELTAFFAFWFSTFNVVSLLIQLFLTRKIVGTYGVGVSLFVLPGGVLLGSLVILFTPQLWAGVLTKLWEVSVKQSVNKAATELLSLPIPTSIKSQTKSFIDVFVDMAATGIGGFLLIILVNGLGFSVRSVSLLTMVIIGIWLWVAYKVRGEYIRSFKSKLSQADKKSEIHLPNFEDTSVINGLKRALETGTDNQVIYVLKKVTEISDKRLFDDTARLLTHKSGEVRLQALICLFYLKKDVDRPLLETLLHDENQEIRYKAFSLLVRQSTEDRIALFDRYLQHEDPKISGAALLSLAETSRNNPEMKRVMKLEQRLKEKLEFSRLSDDVHEKILFKVMVIRAAGEAMLESFYPLIETSLADQNEIILEAGIRAAGQTMHIQFIPLLSEHLLARKTRVLAQNALLNYGVGVVPELKRFALNPQTKHEIACLIPSVLERLDSQQSVDTLLSFLDVADVNLRMEALRALNSIQQEFPHRKVKKSQIIEYIIEEINLYKKILGIFYQQRRKIQDGEGDNISRVREQLVMLLERRIDGTLERIFRLLGLRYPPDDVIPVYQGIRSVNPSIRSNSVEFLDNLLEPSLKRNLLPIAEMVSIDLVSSEILEDLNIKVLEEKKCLELLLAGRDPKLKMAVLKLIEAIDRQEYLDLVRPLIDSPVLKVRAYAQRILEA